MVDPRYLVTPFTLWYLAIQILSFWEKAIELRSMVIAITSVVFIGYFFVTIKLFWDISVKSQKPTITESALRWNKCGGNYHAIVPKPTWGPAEKVCPYVVITFRNGQTRCEVQRIYLRKITSFFAKNSKAIPDAGITD